MIGAQPATRSHTHTSITFAGHSLSLDEKESMAKVGALI